MRLNHWRNAFRPANDDVGSSDIQFLVIAVDLHNHRRQTSRVSIVLVHRHTNSSYRPLQMSIKTSLAIVRPVVASNVTTFAPVHAHSVKNSVRSAQERADDAPL